jgi:hypothetical protein
MRALDYYFYKVELDGKKIDLPISGIGLTMMSNAIKIIDKALEIASKDACCSQQSEAEFPGRGSQD